MGRQNNLEEFKHGATACSQFTVNRSFRFSTEFLPPTGVYDVCASQDLASWLVIGRVTADRIGSFQFLDVDSVTLPLRCYRLRQITAPVAAR